jgi:hypothetical protein
MLLALTVQKIIRFARMEKKIACKFQKLLSKFYNLKFRFFDYNMRTYLKLKLKKKLFQNLNFFLQKLKKTKNHHVMQVRTVIIKIKFY